MSLCTNPTTDFEKAIVISNAARLILCRTVHGYCGSHIVVGDGAYARVGGGYDVRRARDGQANGEGLIAFDYAILDGGYRECFGSRLLCL